MNELTLSALMSTVLIESDFIELMFTVDPITVEKFKVEILLSFVVVVEKIAALQ
jgi:hypothetical protein